jgi:hypothetical protein
MTDIPSDREADILTGLRRGVVPSTIRRRLAGARHGRLPWLATLTPAELLLARSHGFKPIATVSATCWLHYAWSWTRGHAEGWTMALRRLKDEAREAGANAVLDVKMRTLPLPVEESMDFTLLGTAVRVQGLPPSDNPIVATIPALELVRLLQADVVPTGIAVGAHYEWLYDWKDVTNLTWSGNVESVALSSLWERVRRQAHRALREDARRQGNGVLAHVNFSQILEHREKDQPRRYLARHIVVATTVDARRNARALPEVGIVVDLHGGATPLTRRHPHHQSYASNEQEGAI